MKILKLLLKVNQHLKIIKIHNLMIRNTKIYQNMMIISHLQLNPPLHRIKSKYLLYTQMDIQK